MNFESHSTEDESSEKSKNDNQESSENQEIDRIMNDIFSEKEVSDEDEQTLRTKIEDVVLGEKTEDELTEDEEGMMIAYARGIELEWFKEGNINRMVIDFDLETVKFERFNDEEKVEKIKERRENAKEELAKEEIDIPEENDYEELKDSLKNQLAKETEAYSKLYKNQNAENFLNSGGKDDLKKIIESLKNSNQIALNLERLEYYQLACQDKGLQSLIKQNHIEKDYTIRTLEGLIEKFDVIFEILNKQEELLTENEKTFLEQLTKLIRENKLTIAAIVTLLVAGGLLVAFGPELTLIMPSLEAGLLGEKILIAAKSVATITTASVTAGTLVTGALAGAYSYLNEERRDQICETIAGVPLPSWARDKNEK